MYWIELDRTSVPNKVASAEKIYNHPHNQLLTGHRLLFSVGWQTLLEVQGQTQEGLWDLKMNTWLAETPVHCSGEQIDASWSTR